MNGTKQLPLAWFATLSPLLVFALVYLPAAGHGFIADDFGWIYQARVRSTSDLWRVLHSDNGFYRPIVSLSFTLNEWLFGTSPRAYGLTNVALALGCGSVVYAVCRAMLLPVGAGLFGAALWLLNFHGVNGAILWISGRTALLVTIGAGAAAASFLRGHDRAALAWMAFALFSKEEAVAFPAILAAWTLILHGRDGLVRRIATIVASVILVAVYLAIRAGTDAMTPLTAPSYYRLTYDPATVARNVLEYADRVGTLPVAALLLAWCLLGNRPGPLSGRQRRILACSAVWVAATFAITIFVPARSSLYVCLPGVGVCVAAAMLAEHMWPRAEPSRRRAALVVAALLPLALFPVYVARTHRLVTLADFSRRALSDITRATNGLPDGSLVVVEDDRGSRLNLSTAFGNLLPEAFALESGRNIRLWVEPPIGAAMDEERPCNGCEALRLFVREGEVIDERLDRK